MIPFGGDSGSKAMPLRGNGFCCFEYSLEPSVQTRTKQQKPAQLCWLLNLRRERDCPRCARTSGDSTSKKQMPGLRPLSFFIAFALENKFSTLHQRKMPHKGAFVFLCGERGIRTPGPVTVNGFQDRRIRPLCHLSGAKVKHQSRIMKKSSKNILKLLTAV